MNVLIMAHHGTGRYVMIVYMKDYLLVKMENLLDWIGNSLVDFALDIDEELFEEDEEL